MKAQNKTTFGKIVSVTLAAIVSYIALPVMAETVPVYTYHNHPPFILEAGKGLSFDFVDFLNKKSKGNPTFKLEVVSRAQLDTTVATPNFSGVIA